MHWGGKSYFIKIIHKKILLQGQSRGCSCIDCEIACPNPDFGPPEEEFVIVEGVDGVVFIMTIIFILGTIIFLAIVVGSNVIKKSAFLCKFSRSNWHFGAYFVFQNHLANDVIEWLIAIYHLMTSLARWLWNVDRGEGQSNVT